MEELRAQCEREYRNNEIKKTDALVELKETKARIIDLQKQKAMAEKEIVAKADMLVSKRFSITILVSRQVYPYLICKKQFAQFVDYMIKRLIIANTSSILKYFTNVNWYYILY